MGSHATWRYTLMSGVIPAIPLLIIRPFLPESPKWKEKKAAGTLKRPSFIELFQPKLLRTTIVTSLMFAFAYGAAFGAIQHLPRIVPGLPGVKDLKPPAQQQMVSKVQATQELGGMFGRIALALLAVVVVSPPQLLWIFQVPGMIIVPL